MPVDENNRSSQSQSVCGVFKAGAGVLNANSADKEPHGTERENRCGTTRDTGTQSEVCKRNQQRSAEWKKGSDTRNWSDVYHRGTDARTMSVLLDKTAQGVVQRLLSEQLVNGRISPANVLTRNVSLLMEDGA